MRITMTLTSHAYPRFADDLDRMELRVHPQVARRVAPLLDRLRRHTLSKTGRRRLISAFIENAMLTGQVDETMIMLQIVDRYWVFCPLRYLPTLWPTPKPVELFHNEPLNP